MSAPDQCTSIHLLDWQENTKKKHHFSLSIQDDKWARVKYSKEKQKLTEIKKK